MTACTVLYVAPPSRNLLCCSSSCLLFFFAVLDVMVFMAFDVCCNGDGERWRLCMIQWCYVLTVGC